MKRLSTLCWGLVGIALLSPGTLLNAQPPTTLPTSTTRVPSPRDIYKPLIGSWKGELTYRDYTSDKQVTLPTLLDATITPDNSLRLHYVYDDGPGKQVEETDSVTVDLARHTYRTQGLNEKDARTYTASGLETFAQKGGGTLVLLGTGEENGKKVEVRNTLTLSGQNLTLLHETRLPKAAYRFRNRYRFTRTQNAPATTTLTAAQRQADSAIFKKDCMILVGETTGGNQRGINGAFFLFRRPESKSGMRRVEDVRAGTDTELSTLQRRLQKHGL